MARRSRKSPRNNSSRKIYNIDSIADGIAKELENYSEEVTYAVKDVVWDVTDRLVGRTKQDAKVGRRKGKYKKSISSKTLFENKHKLVEVWYVKKPEYRLAHLLNNGHRIKDGKFIPGDNHITKNEKIAIKELEEGIERAIKDGT